MVLHNSTLLITVSGPEKPCDISKLAAETICLKDKAWLQATALIGVWHQQTSCIFKENEIHFLNQHPKVWVSRLKMRHVARAAASDSAQILPKVLEPSIIIDLAGSLTVIKTG